MMHKPHIVHHIQGVYVGTAMDTAEESCEHITCVDSSDLKLIPTGEIMFGLILPSMLGV